MGELIELKMIGSAKLEVAKNGTTNAN